MLSLTYTDLIQHIRPYFTPTILNRGWEYYREGAVGRLKTDGGSIITANVEGTEDYSVRLDIANFTNSRCNCPFGGCCKHMASVLFEAARRAGLEPRQFLKPDRTLVLNKQSNPKNALQTEMALGTAQTASTASRVPTAIEAARSAEISNQDTKAPAKKPRATMPKESGSAEDWQRYFEKQFEKYPAYSMHSIETFLPTVTRSLFSFGQAWKPTLKHLYDLQVTLFTMKRADELQAQIGRNYSYHVYQYAEYFHSISNTCQERLVQIVRDIDIEAARQQYPGLLQETATYLAEYGFPEHSSVMRWSGAYGVLWWNLLRDQAGIAAERHRLEAAIAKRGILPRKKDALLISAMLFDVMDGKDQHVMSRASKELTDKQPGMFFPFLQTLYSSDEWDRLILWLDWMRPLVKTSGSAYMEPYFHYWQEAGKHRDLEKEWKETISFLLPASFPYYSQFLIKQQRYQEWADLNLLFYRSPLEINPDTLKLVEAQDIHFLLPLYHFAVERSILEKNRSSYKVAVKLLKKLHQFYKKLKEQDRWERYIIHVSTQFSRYRAFQEELRKGKLIV
jgi:uncharacterized Zn finger protein